MVHPSMYAGGVRQVGYESAYGGYSDGAVYGNGYGNGYGEVYAGGYGGGSYCDSPYCDAAGGCDGMCDGGCDSGCFGSCCSHLFEGGLLGKMCEDDGMCFLRHLCVFCRGDGCGACQGMSTCGAMIKCLLPYSEAGICAQRWYDVSAEAVFLGHSSSGQSGLLTTNGVEGVPVLFLSDVDDGDTVEGGVRISGSLIFGVASNLELTYMGGQQWSDEAAAFSDTPTLFSFISYFGTDPAEDASQGIPPGFDDTDRSFVQGLQVSSDFHSAEWNYRRRTMGPYCRFQGSWLVGLRYLRFDNRMIYSAFGEVDDTSGADMQRFFVSNDKVKNNLFGPQAGFDFWWNVISGVNLGIGMKGAWVQNDAKRQTILSANSIDPVVLSETRRSGTTIGELEATLIYRFTHSWSFRSSYYVIGVDDVSWGTVDRSVARAFNMPGVPVGDPAFYEDSLVLQGFSLGTEYMW
jgi:hypothetical protein